MFLEGTNWDDATLVALGANRIRHLPATDDTPAGVEVTPDIDVSGYDAALPAARAARLAAYAAARRWEAQNAGTTWNGHAVPTDKSSRADVAEAIQSIDIGILSAPVGWKLPSGFVALDRTELVALAGAMAAHVQAAFAAEAQVLADIAAGTITTTTEIDAAF